MNRVSKQVMSFLAFRELLQMVRCNLRSALRYNHYDLPHVFLYYQGFVISEGKTMASICLICDFTNDKLVEMWEEAVLAHIMALHLEWLRKTTKILNTDRRHHDENSNTEPYDLLFVTQLCLPISDGWGDKCHNSMFSLTHLCFWQYQLRAKWRQEARDYVFHKLLSVTRRRRRRKRIARCKVAFVFSVQYNII